MKTDTNGDGNSELETRTLRSSDGPADPRRSTPPEVVLADMWGNGAPAPQAPMEEADGGSRAPSSSGGCEGDDDGGSEPEASTDDCKGVLYCCGRRLKWVPSECDCCMEVICGGCGRIYAMGLIEEALEECDEIGLEAAVVAEKLKEMSLLDGGLYKGPSKLGFAG